MPALEAKDSNATPNAATPNPGSSEPISADDQGPRVEAEEGLPEHRTTVFFVALAALAIAATLGRSALPFSSAEAGFVHQAMRSLALTLGPDFEPVGSAREAGILARAFLETGVTERSARLLVFFALAASGILVMATAGARKAATAIAVAAWIFGATAIASADLVSPGFVLTAPAALAATALGRFRRSAAWAAAVGSAAGLSALAHFDVGTAAAVAAALVVGAIALKRSAAIARACGATAAAAAVAAFEGASAPSIETSFAPAAAALHTMSHAAVGSSLAGPAAFGAVFAVPLFGILARRVSGGGRVSAILAVASAFVVASFLSWNGSPPRPDRVAGAMIPFVALLVARTVESGGVFARLAYPLALVVACAAPLRFGSAATREDPRDLLTEARRVATAADAVAFGGPARVGLAVYARLGHDPNMPYVFVPEDVALKDLAVAARRLGARVLWTDFDASAAPGLKEAPPDAARGEPTAARLRRYVVSDP